jgi:hypothetical protein
MAKLLTDPISKNHIQEYLDEYSDFAFELKVLKKLGEMGFACEHGAVYEDPVTKKAREFDIRGTKKLGFRQLRVSVECKNIRNNYPLVAHCVKRTAADNFHELLVSPARNRSNIFKIGNSSSTRVRIIDSLYLEGEYVAKSVDQVGRTTNGIVSNDGSVFEKINQALHSAYDLIETAHYERPQDSEKICLILPILVIPDDRLWCVKYEDDGSRISDPEIVDHLTLFVGQSWRVGHENTKEPMFSNLAWYTLSHLEIITVSSLPKVFNEYFNPDDDWSKAFTKESPLDLLNQEDDVKE